jgi:hypothetical protein
VKGKFRRRCVAEERFWPLRRFPIRQAIQCERQQEGPMIELRKSVKRTALAAASLVLAGVSVAQAQTTVITREPVETRTVVTTEPLRLTPAQRHRIYRTVVQERAAPPQAVVEYRVGTRIPSDVVLHPLPRQVAVDVPVIEPYKYMVVNDRVLLVDPATSEVVAELDD